MDAIVQQFFNLAIMEQALPLILAGLKQTLIICVIVIPLGLAGGLAFALTSLSRARTVRWAAIAGLDFFRAIPPLVLLIFIYAGLPFAGFRPSPLMAVAIAFFLNTSSYYGEIYRAGVESVGRGQWDAARSTGLRGVPDASLCRAAAGGAQRTARPRVQHGRGGEAHLDCERGGAAGAALFSRHGALGDLQFVADRTGRGNLPYYAVAGCAFDQPAGTADRDVKCGRIS
jgi:His/Glu/Gln/Arg/opine family amino acid ABC transporter permease subunit